MQPDEIAPELKAWRKRRMVEPGPTTTKVELGRTEIERLLQHRDPFLFVDQITAIDLEQKWCRGVRRIHPKDPVFVGHFPQYPIYPGVLCLETMGQLGICLLHFLATKTVAVPTGTSPRPVRALKIHHALFQGEVLPGDEVEILAKLVSEDDYTAICGGQLIKNGAIVSMALMEVYLVSE